MNERYTEQQLANMGVEILGSLKNKGLRIKDIKRILNHALIAVDYIVYGGEAAEEQSKG